MPDSRITMRSGAELIFSGMMSSPPDVDEAAGQIEAIVRNTLIEPYNGWIRNNIVWVIGDRGAGKSTVLAAALRKLNSASNTICLRRIASEDLWAGGSLVEYILSDLERRVENAAGTESKAAHVAPLQEVRRILGIAISASQNPDLSASGLGQMAADRMYLAHHWTNLTERVNDAVQTVLGALGLKPDTAIIVPLDDPELSPHTGPGLSQDLSLLSNVPNVIPIVCSNALDLRLSLKVDAARRLGERDQESISRVVDAQYMKLIDPDRRLTLAGVDVKSRAAFAPIDTGQHFTIRELIGQCDSQLGTTIASFMENSANNFLPAMPRQLTLAWRAWARLHDSLVGGEAARAASAFIQLSDLLLASDPSLAEVRAVSIWADHTSRDSSESIRLASEIETRGELLLQLGVSTGSTWRTVVKENSLQIRTRTVMRARASLVERTAARTTSDSPLQHRYLSQGGTNAVLVLDELLQSYVFEGGAEKVDSFGIYLGDDDSAYLQLIKIGGKATDDRFFLLPFVTGLSGTRRWMDVWKAIFIESEIESVNANGTALQDPETMCVSFVAGVTAAWCGEAGTKSWTDLSIVEALRACSLHYLDRWACIQADGSVPLDTEEILAGPCSTSTRRNYEFVTWFEIALPMMFAHALLGDATVSVIHEWQLALSMAGRDRSIRKVREILDQRFRAARSRPNQEWIYTYSALALEVGFQNTEFSDLRQRYERLVRDASAGTKLAVGGIVELVQDENPFAKNQYSPEGKREEQYIRTVLAQMEQMVL